MSALKLVTGTFTDAAERFAVAVNAGQNAEEGKCNTASRLYAIGFLSGMTKTQINEQAYKLGQFTEEAWKSGKVILSMAHRSIAGEFGFSTELAQQWASGDFSIPLKEAYRLSAGPRKNVDRVAKVVKEMLALSEVERVEVADRVAEALENIGAWHIASSERFEVLKSAVQKVA